MGELTLPANIREEDSETPWLTSEEIDFIDKTPSPWCAHLSYIKPHRPHIVPDPYASMFGVENVPPANRADAECEGAHPVFDA